MREVANALGKDHDFNSSEAMPIGDVIMDVSVSV
jgi:hypothetical protein